MIEYSEYVARARTPLQTDLCLHDESTVKLRDAHSTPVSKKAEFAEVANRAEGDVDLLVYGRFFKNVLDGVFIEVGAARPDYLSIGAFYRRLGWRVISIEPNPTYADLHRMRGHEIVQCACGDRDEDNVSFVVVDMHGARYENGTVSFESHSSLAIKDSYAATLPTSASLSAITVNLRRLDAILAEQVYPIEHLDLLCIDTEGWELEVLRGLDFDRYSPGVLIIENVFFDRTYRRFMRDRGYMLWKRIGYNEVYAQTTRLRPVERVWCRVSLALLPAHAKIAALVSRVRSGVAKRLHGHRDAVQLAATLVEANAAPAALKKRILKANGPLL